MEKKRHIVIGKVFVSIFVILFGLELQSSEVAGQSKYPSKPVGFVCALSAGGQADIAGRHLAEALKRKLGQPFVVINKPGGGGMLGAHYLTKAAPDGYTIGSMGDAQTITVFLVQKPPYKLEEIRSIAQWAYHNTTVVVPADSPWKSMQELIDYAKQNPGVKYGHTGKGSSPWMQMQYLTNDAGIQMDGIPFDADKIALAVVAKNVPVGICGYINAVPMRDARQLRILMTFTTDGIDGEPDIPTIKDVLKREVTIYPPTMTIMVPAKTPESVVKILDKAVKEITSDPAFLAKMRGLGIGVKYLNETQLKVRQKDMAELQKKLFTEAKLIKE